MAKAKVEEEIVKVSLPSATRGTKNDYRCGDCFHFEKGMPLFNKHCSLLGILEDRPAPQCFNPDFTKVILNTSPMMFHQLGFLLGQMTAPQIRILSSIINRANLIKKYTKLQFGQAVYFNIEGSREYISNYFKGYVVGYLRKNKTLFISANMSKKNPYTASLMLWEESVLNQQQWKERCQQLKKDGKIQDPKAEARSRMRTTNINVETYEPPTMENAPAEWVLPHHARAKLSKEDKKKFIDVYDKFTITE